MCILLICVCLKVAEFPPCGWRNERVLSHTCFQVGKIPLFLNQPLIAGSAEEEKITGLNPSGASTFHVARQINQTFQLARSMDQILIFNKITQPIH